MHRLRSTMQGQRVRHNRTQWVFFYTHTHTVNQMNYSASLSELQVVFCHSSQSVPVRVVLKPFPQSILHISPAITARQTALNLYNLSLTQYSPPLAWKGFSGTNSEHCFSKPEALHVYRSPVRVSDFPLREKWSWVTLHFGYCCLLLPSSHVSHRFVTVCLQRWSHTLAIYVFVTQDQIHCKSLRHRQETFYQARSWGSTT